MNDVTSVDQGSPTAPPASPTTPPSSDGSSTAGSSTPTTNASRKPWSGLGYEQVPGLANRIISRYLRGQRKNMERFFKERGLHESAERMRQIRLSRQGMMAKNRMFQEVLGEYARGATTVQNPQATPVEGDGGVVLRDAVLADDGTNSGGRDDGVSVPQVAANDGDEPVIEE